MRAVPILEVLRSGVMRGTSLPQLEKDPKGYITSLVLALTPIAFEKLGAALMEFVDWRTAEDKDWIPATGNENDAFRNLEGVDIYRIVVQGVGCNFLASFRARGSLFAQTTMNDPLSTIPRN